MTYEPDHPARNEVNIESGDVGGLVVQANTIEGGVHHHRPARSAVTLPYQFGILPPRAMTFQDRVTDLLAWEPNRASADLLAPGPAYTNVLFGLGGVGKTQLALHYAEQAWAAGELDLLVWVTASSRDAIVSSYAHLVKDLTGTEDRDRGRAAQRLIEWLRGTPNRWLVVLDDVQRPADLHGLWPPTTSTGRVVVTTRRNDAALRGHRRRLVEVGTFRPDEAHAYMHNALADHPHRLDGATELPSRLGYLPLALAQAVAYILDRDLTCATYQERLADRRLRLDSLLPEKEGLPDEHRATVTATWSLSIEQANRLTPTGLAGPLLEVASFLDANGIPAAVFSARAILELLTADIGREVTEQAARDGLTCLRRLSLVTLDSNAHFREVRVHELVQRTTRDGLSGKRISRLVHAAADALVQVWAAGKKDSVLGQVLRANTEALHEVGRRDLWEPCGHMVLLHAGRSLESNGLFHQALSYYACLRDAAHHYLGAQHSDTLMMRSKVAHCRGKAGDPARALTEFEELAGDEARILGPDNVYTLNTRSNVAHWRGKAGDARGAVAAFEELLADQSRVLGPGHSYTLNTRNNIATWRGKAGDAAGAIAGLEELLAEQSQALGPNHPDTLNIRGNIAYWHGKGGDAAGAVAAFEELANDEERIWGQNHLRVMHTRSNIAYWRDKAGDTAGAVAQLEELFADQRRVLGPDHPSTIHTGDKIAHCRKRLCE